MITEKSLDEALELYNAVNRARKMLGIRSYNKWVVLKRVCEITRSEYLPSLYGIKSVLLPFVNPIKYQLEDTLLNSIGSWRTLRYEALKKYGRKCACCGSMPPDVVLHVDHIKPKSKYPELEFDIENLQILCEACNLGKGNRDCNDYRV